MSTAMMAITTRSSMSVNPLRNWRRDTLHLHFKE
jgi:hypothetical protein